MVRITGWSSRSWVLALLCGLAAPATGAYLEGDDPAQPVRPRPPVVMPPRPRTNETTRLLDRIRVHPAIRIAGLTVFPLTADPADPWPYGRLLTLGEGLASGVIEVHEMTPPTVQRARFVNHSDAYVYVMGGEVILGGKQNRSVRHDALLAPHSETILTMYCVQQGRWSAAAPFGRSPSCLPLKLRDLSARGANQSDVWDEIRKSNRRLGVKSETEDFQAGVDNAKVRAGLDRTRRMILPRLPDNCIGLVVARHGRIVGADVFIDAALFHKMRDKVLDSYGYGLFGPVHRRFLGQVTPDHARRFLDRVYRARFEPGQVGGIGRVRLIRGAANGYSLVFDDRCLHLNLVQNLFVPMPQPPRRGFQP